MPKRVIVMNFDANAKAFQAFSEVKKLHASRGIKGEQMAVLTHTNTGVHQFKIEDFLDFTGSNKTSTGGLIGMLVGILGGPLGIMLGWFGGSMIGASRDAKEIQNAQVLFEHVGQQIGVGDTGLLLLADEDDNRPLNQLIMQELGGDISRFDSEEVETEIEKAKEVEEQARVRAQEDWKNSHDQNDTQNDTH
ncbi:DUF456 domain-containing protein [Enterococcus sp. RIT-PI-f]|uniref:DUF456 domain-containing protein n=1 Tax=Enterococcus sp. RIT-PI-f TaxID=1690244 RepID=UPI0006B8D8B5|nr:DUF456 domain-containing protein [Enterococcus sp. RIT-PI-f]KPG71641.1 hypothetical protein AEQ18_03110 [Enterococcus sp. RIT-PI-f]